MKVSVVIATYNGSAFLKEQLDSIVCQTVKPDEIVLFDDCSTDTTKQIIDDFVREYDQLHWSVQYNDRNLGFRKNFYEALKASTGDLIFLCDQDDIWLPDKIDEMKQAMAGNDEINLLAGTYTEMYSDGRKEERNIGKIPGEKVCCDPEKALYRIVNTKNIVRVNMPGCSYCIRRSFFDLCDRYWIDTCPHDAVLWRYASLTDSIYILDKPLMLYRRHSTSTWQKEKTAERKHNKEKQLMWRDAELKELLCISKFAEEENISETYRKRIRKNIRFAETRKKFYLSGNPVYGFSLLKYYDQYPQMKGWLRDWKVAYSPSGEEKKRS